MHNEIIVSLFLIIFCYIFIQVFTFSYIKKREVVKFGPEINRQLKSLKLEDINSKSITLGSIISNKKNLILFVDANCQHCKNILESFEIFNRELLDDIYFILINNKENKIAVKKMGSHKNFLLINEKVMLEELNIKVFPFFLELDDSSYITNKGYGSNGTIVEFLT